MDFLKENPYLIAVLVSVGCFLLELFITYISGKNKTKLVNLAKVVQRIPFHVKEAEAVLGSGNGVQKLQYCLQLIYLDCVSFGLKDFEERQGQFIAEIEKVLDTPQKKGIETIDNEIQVEN